MLWGFSMIVKARIHSLASSSSFPSHPECIVFFWFLFCWSFCLECSLNTSASAEIMFILQGVFEMILSLWSFSACLSVFKVLQSGLSLSHQQIFIKVKLFLPISSFRSVVSKTSFFFFWVVLGLHLRHMEVPRLGIQLELQLPATAMWDLSHICNLHHSSR